MGCHPVAAGGPSLSGRSSPKRRGRGLRGQEGGGAGEPCLLHERGPGDRLRSCPSPGGHTAWQKPVISSQAFAPAGRGTADSTRPSRSQAAWRRSGLCFRTQAPPSTWPSGAPQALRSHTHRGSSGEALGPLVPLCTHAGHERPAQPQGQEQRAEGAACVLGDPTCSLSSPRQLCDEVLGSGL